MARLPPLFHPVAKGKGFVILLTQFPRQKELPALWTHRPPTRCKDFPPPPFWPLHDGPATPPNRFPCRRTLVVLEFPDIAPPTTAPLCFDCVCPPRAHAPPLTLPTKRYQRIAMQFVGVAVNAAASRTTSAVLTLIMRRQRAVRQRLHHGCLTLTFFTPPK